MSVEIITTDNFRREAKRLIKKYPSLKSDLIKLNEQLLINPKLGTPIGSNCFKIRLAIPSKAKGKRGGARIISHLRSSAEIDRIYLMTIYDKSEFDSITDKALKRMIDQITEQ